MHRAKLHIKRQQSPLLSARNKELERVKEESTGRRRVYTEQEELEKPEQRMRDEEHTQGYILSALDGTNNRIEGRGEVSHFLESANSTNPCRFIFHQFWTQWLNFGFIFEQKKSSKRVDGLGRRWKWTPIPKLINYLSYASLSTEP